MKIILSVILLSVCLSSTTLAQNTGTTAACSINTVQAPISLTGTTNYLFSLSTKDLNNKTYIFYTDSSATIAYMNINGKVLRLTGGPNPEHMIVYTCNDYTVTLNNLTNAGIEGKPTTAATLVVYNKMGKALVNRVIGSLISKK